MQLSNRYKRPTIVARLNDQGYDRGSARGLNQSELSDFKQFLMDSGYFEYAQGHANAFGISIPDDNLSAFHDYANMALNNIDFGENIYEVNFIRNICDSDIVELILALGQQSALWGQGTPEPLIHIKNIHVTPNNIRIMGKEMDTVKIEVNGVALMKFKANDFIEELKQRDNDCILEVVGKANLNEWGGRITPQIFIEDYEIKSSSVLEF